MRFAPAACALALAFAAFAPALADSMMKASPKPGASPMHDNMKGSAMHSGAMKGSMHHGSMKGHHMMMAAPSPKPTP